MRHLLKMLSILAFACLSLTVAAEEALPPKTLLGTEIDPRLPDVATYRVNAPQCYLRQYSKAHMAQHPAQTVTAVGYCAELVKKTETYNREAIHYEYMFKFAVRLKDRKHRLWTGGICGYWPNDTANGLAKDAIHCRVECDGGGIEIRPIKAQKLIRIGLPDRIRMYTCGDADSAEKFVDLTGGVDDRTFQLKAIPVKSFKKVFGPDPKPMEFD